MRLLYILSGRIVASVGLMGEWWASLDLLMA
jgi:hypothetical protein